MPYEHPCQLRNHSKIPIKMTLVKWNHLNSVVSAQSLWPIIVLNFFLFFSEEIILFVHGKLNFKICRKFYTFLQRSFFKLYTRFKN